MRPLRHALDRLRPRRNDGPDRPISSSRRLGTVVVLGLAFVAVGFSSVLQLERERESYSYLVRTNSWIASQVEFEILRFTHTLDRYRLGDPDIEPADVRRRFDILWSRVPVALTGVEAKGLRRIEGAESTLTGLAEELERIDPKIQSLETANAASLRAIPESLAPHLDRMHELAVAMHVGAGHEALVAEVERNQLRTRAVVLALILLGVVVAALLLLEVRRSHRAVRREHALRVEADAANRAKSLFLANMSHELRTPLNAIMGFTEMMREEVFGRLGNVRYRGYVNDIHDSASHLLSVLSDLLDMARIEAGNLELEEDAVDVGEQVGRCLTILAGNIREKGIAVETAAPDSDARLRGDARMIRQIVLNLLSNAVKFTERGGTIHIAHDVRSGQWTIRVGDNGIGIDPVEAARLTEPFYQGGKTRRSGRGGSGLGLALVRSLVEAHGGRFEIAGTPGAGTVATVVFPAARTLPPPGRAEPGTETASA